MENLNNAMRMLSCIERPAFIVADRKILKVNAGASAMQIHPETSLVPLLGEHRSAYESFTEGTLRLTLTLDEKSFAAHVEKLEGCDLFILETEQKNAQLTALAMASTQLRIPLTGLMNTMSHADPQANRMLYQLHRAVSNMSDALRYSEDRAAQLQTLEISGWLSEIVESVAAHTESLGIQISYKPSPAPLYCAIDEELLRRAVLNLISNSLKAGSTLLQIKITKQPKTVSITLTDNGKGVAEDRRADMFRQYTQAPNLGNPDYGLGLGMVIVKAAAAAHKGTILLEHQKDGGLRATLTISNAPPESILRAPILRIDYLGGRDPVLTELSDILPNSEY